MKNSADLFRRCGALALGCLALVTGRGFTYVINDDTGLPIKWPPGSIPVRIELGTVSNLGDGTSFNTTAQEAANTWNTRIGSAQILATQVPAAAAAEHNGLNELAFADDVFGQAFDDNVLAVTTGFSTGNERTEADIVFNRAKSWDSYRGALQSKTDLRRVALHELGHLLGLDHPDEASPKQTVTSIMNSHVGNLDTLADDDITAIQGIYGPPGVPANNNFASAATIDLATGTLTVSGYNTNATKEAGEPNHGGDNGGRSVWYRWTPPSNGNVTIDTRTSYFDTLLGVYTGAALNSLAQVASSDDIDPGKVQASTVTFNVAGGTTYFIAVDGFNNDDGTGADCASFKLNLSYTVTSAAVPTITSQPASATVDAGGTVTFSVTAAGTGPLSYQWLFNGTAIPGATSSSFGNNNVQTGNAGTYSVTVSNVAGSVTSTGAILTVHVPAPVTPPPTTPPSGGGGGGGGAPSAWFVSALAILGLHRRLRRRH